MKVERETDESFALSYGEDGYLHQVTDHTGRTITYQMQDDKLRGVCSPSGH